MREYYRENSFRFPSLPGCVASHATSITSITSLRYVRYVLDYAVIAVAFRRCSRCYVEGGFSAAVISLPLNNTQRGAAQRRIARACGIIQCRVPWSVKRLICCAMAVTHLTISVKKTADRNNVGVDERRGNGSMRGNTTRRVFYGHFAVLFRLG